jgi:Flp pilus assembly pilin Flp
MDIDEERYKKIITRMQTLEREAPLPVYSTSMIAEPFDKGERTIRGYLGELSDKGIIRTYSFGGSRGTRVWWLPDENESPLSPEDVAAVKKQYIDWDYFGYEDIPDEVLEELAIEGLHDYEPQVLWNAIKRDGNAAIRYGLIAIFLVVGIQFIGINVSDSISGALAIIGLILSVLGIISSISGSVGKSLAEMGYLPEDPTIPILYD